MTTLLLSRADVERLLTPDSRIEAVEDAFRRLAQGTVPAPAILAMHATEGSFHVKAGLLSADRVYFAAKVNANFPQNGPRHTLPTIQGAVLLFDAGNGKPLAVMDSIAITAIRTAAASAVAAKYLAAERCNAALICGCGGQALAQLRALLHVRRPQRVGVYDQDQAKATAFAKVAARELAMPVVPVRDLARAVEESDLTVTCTTARRYHAIVAGGHVGARRARVARRGRRRQKAGARKGRRDHRLRFDRHRSSGRRRGDRGISPGARGKSLARLQPSRVRRGVSTYSRQMTKT